MTSRLLLLAAVGVSALALTGCDYSVSSTSDEPPAPPVETVEAPAAEDVAVDAAETTPEPAQQTAPPPSDTGDMGDARDSATSVEPDSETVFY